MKPTVFCSMAMVAIVVTSFGSKNVSAEGLTVSELAHLLHRRLAGVSAPENVRPQMENALIAGDYRGAARFASAHPSFINTTIRQWFTPLVNRDGNPHRDLTDSTALVMGIVRDELDARLILTGNFAYVGNPDVIANFNKKYPTNRTNLHYQELGRTLMDIAANLVRVSPQREATKTLEEGVWVDDFTEVPESAAAGVLTTREWGAQFITAGTNRRVIEFMFKSFLCAPLSEVHDVSAPDYRVRRDVDRVPGGEASVYVNQCSGCHAGLDAMAGALAHFNFQGRMRYSAGVQSKMNKNGDVYSPGYITTGNTWLNFFNANQNTSLGWTGPSSGRGLPELASLFATTDAFPRCMAKRAFEFVCRREADASEQSSVIPELSDQFVSSGYNIRELFEMAVIRPECLPR